MSDDNRILYANVIVDISNEKLDRTFQYKIPKELVSAIVPGVQVQIPFGKGNRILNGYVVEVTDQSEYDPDKVKEIEQIAEGSIPIESQLIALAAWMRKNYGATLNQALKTVIPIKKQTRQIEKKSLHLILSVEEAHQQLALLTRKNQKARCRLLEALIEDPILSYEVVTGKLNISASVIRFFEETGVIRIESVLNYRNPIAHLEQKEYTITLNREQQNAVDTILTDYRNHCFRTYLLHGVTGCGKTEIYMELIANVIEMGKQAIVLIPEIALTYQTVMRFYNRFGDRVSIMNSRMSQGERYDQFERAKKGEIDIVIGPRSALFTPFLHLGLIIIDEEHESTYKSEPLPRYHARETAIERARMSEGAAVVLGSATPSVDSYFQAMNGMYQLIELKERVEQKPLPECEIIDLREELKAGNFSILSRRLQEQMADRLARKEQMMLFINRRGLSGFMSCRECGHVMKCPHCEVSLSQHNNGRLICHYCGYQEKVPDRCPVCNSRYISGFKAGTQKIEEVVRQLFPAARVLRMDFDTTRTKDSYEQILSAFAAQEADILIGTQMIVKGHDFSNVTLVGILAADLSLHVSDYRAAERTFQLLTQAAGRAGRGDRPGEVVIQTYSPGHYAILAAREQDYLSFYRQEIEFRKLMSYPPSSHLLSILITGKDQMETADAAVFIQKFVKWKYADLIADRQLALIGPADAAVSKVNDIYRKVLYIKQEQYQCLIQIKDDIEDLKQKAEIKREDRKNPYAVLNQAGILFDFDPMHGF